MANQQNSEMNLLIFLLQDRFKGEPCNDTDYFVVLMCYIHHNPVKAGLAKTAKEYCYGQLSRVTGMNYETIRNIAKKLP